MSEISIQQYGKLEEKEILLFKIVNSQGAYIEVLNFGATLVSVVIPNKQGIFQNMILRYNNIESYFSDKFYLGATIGRVANRISGAKFKLGETTYNLDKNDGENSNHGGFEGLNKKIFISEIHDNKVIFTAFSKDGEGGFPANMEIRVSYFFTNENEVIIDYEVNSDGLTPINFTNHAYFNLSGNKSDATDHRLKFYSTEHLEFDENFLPTGEILSVENSSCYDFRDFEMILQKMQLKNEKNIKGFNAYYIAENLNDKELKLLAELKSESSCILLKVKSTMPGVQFYTGDYLDNEFSPYSGICLEAQYYPDFVKQSEFPSSYVNKGDLWKERIVYDFTVL